MKLFLSRRRNFSLLVEGILGLAQQEKSTTPFFFRCWAFFVVDHVDFNICQRRLFLAAGFLRCCGNVALFGTPWQVCQQQQIFASVINFHWNDFFTNRSTTVVPWVVRSKPSEKLTLFQNSAFWPIFRVDFRSSGPLRASETEWGC